MLFAAFLGLGLVNVFGQRVGTTSASGAVADLEVKAPRAVKSGLIYEVQFTVTAHTALAEPTLVLDSGWWDGFTVNTMSPDTKAWTQRDGRQLLSYDADAGGDRTRRAPPVPGQPSRRWARANRTSCSMTAATPILTLEHDTTVFP